MLLDLSLEAVADALGMKVKKHVTFCPFSCITYSCSISSSPQPFIPKKRLTL